MVKSGVVLVLLPGLFRFILLPDHSIDAVVLGDKVTFRESRVLLSAVNDPSRLRLPSNEGGTFQFWR